MNAESTSGAAPPPRLLAAYPQVFVGDIERAVAFYRDRLGFAVAYVYGDPPFYALVVRDGAGLNLRHADTPVIEAARRDRDSLLSANIPVANVGALFEEFRGRGIDFAQPLTRQPWQTIDFFVRDDDGNLLCFGEAVAPEAP